jgi:hypothetical protein
MKKLQLDLLAVESFATTEGIDEIRGTVAAHSAQCTSPNCPDSWDGTCWMSCWYTCPCTDGPNCP